MRHNHAKEAEAAYQARCEQQAAGRFASSPGPPAAPPSDGAVTCDASAGGEDDTAAVLRLLDDALGGIDKLFSSVGEAELRGAGERLRAQR